MSENQTQWTIGGSEAAAACGQNRYKSRNRLWREKMGIEEPKIFNSKAIEMGNELEPVVISRYAKTTARENGWGVHYFATTEDQRRYPFPDNVLVIPRTRYSSLFFPFMTCHPDGLVIGGDGAAIGVLEAKTAGQFSLAHWGEADDDVPIEYYLQGLHNLHVMRSCGQIAGIPGFVHYPALVGREELLRQIDYSDRMIEDLIASERGFLQYLETSTEPPVDDPKELSDWLKGKYADSGESVQASSEIIEAVLEYERTFQSIKELEGRELDLKNQIQKFLVDKSASKLIGPNFTLNWRSNERSTVDYKALLASLSVADDVIAKFTKTTDVRTFERPKFQKGS